jgi:YHS domain-containing protein
MPSKWVTEDTRGRLDHDEPLGSVERVNLLERMDRWVSRRLAWLIRTLIARALGNSGRASTRHPQDTRSAIPLHRDPWCGTYVSPEISFPLEQAGQVLHFCSTECRARYQRSSQRAASA